MDGLPFNTILANLGVSMEREFEEEVKHALLDCGGDKAPRPNGFNFAFIKAAWDVLKSDFCDMPFEFH